MTTTIIPFVPSAIQAPQFQPTLDGELYTCIVTWNIFGRRYYVNIFTLSGVRILTTAMVGSPLDYDISLTDGYFATKLVFRQSAQQFEIID